MRNLPPIREGFSPPLWIKIGIVPVVAAVILAPLALGQAPAQRVPVQPPRQKVVYGENSGPSEGRPRLEEMKVELALLADPVTFPYYLGVHAAVDTLALCGLAPNEMVRQHALELARRSTFLRVCDKVRIQANLVVTSPPRPPLMLQQEAAELLEQNLGELGLEMYVGVQPDGLIVVAGSVDSLENKLAVSRLFRRLSGCRGVVNELIVQSVPHGGPPVVQASFKESMRKPLPPPDDKPSNTPREVLVTLPVKILVDQAEPMVPNVWEKRLRQRLKEASDILESHCRVRLQVLEVGTWESDAKRTKLSELLQDFQKKADPGAARLVIGFTGLGASKEEADCGCTQGPLKTHILIREWKPRTEPERLEALVHELGHFLGACHSSESDSVMRPKLGDGRVNFRACRLRFDAANTRVMTLVAEELAHRPVHGLEELSPQTRRRLFDIFSTLARAMPDDSTVADAIRRLEGTTPEPLSARQLSPE
jgi:hypothetical protein